MVAQHSSEKDVRILLVGEDGVGKTSLIMSLISEEFPERAPARIDEVTIPADVTPERVPTHIVDFSWKDQDEDTLDFELHRANVICIVYSVHEELSLEKITSYWLPKIHSSLGTEHGKPIILVGNKSDMPEPANMDQVLLMMNQYPDIETCVECSAKMLKNISELFYYAQKAVLHPSAPLFQAEEKELSQMCKKSLVRIFKICDQDNDGLLNDYELNQFQVRCFGIPLTQDAMQDVKTVVRKCISDGILENALTLKGFLYLQMLFIQRGRHETTWTVLRRFGYDNGLQLAKEYLYPTLRVPRGCSTELSYDGFQFLAALFEKYDEDKDGCLSPTELQNLFSLCPNLPWGPDALNTVVTNDKGWITYNGYLSYWVFTTLLDVPRTLEYLAYLGFNASYPNQLSAITITRDKRIDWQKRDTTRNVFHCHVIGPKDVGKTAFLQAFVNRSLKEQAALNKRQLPSYVINTVFVHETEKHLILHEIDVVTPEDALTAYELSCDVVCFIYDISNAHSFEYCARIYKKHFHRTRVPCLFVASKCDRRQVLQEYELQPNEFCHRNRMPPPLRFNASEPQHDNSIYSKVATLAVYPHLKHVYYLHDSALWVKLSLGAAGLALLGFLIYKNV